MQGSESRGFSGSSCVYMSANSDVAQVKRGALAGRDGKTVAAG